MGFTFRNVSSYASLRVEGFFSRVCLEEVLIVRRKSVSRSYFDSELMLRNYRIVFPLKCCGEKIWLGNRFNQTFEPRKENGVKITV